MSKLAPNAAGVYAGVQGVSKLLQDWNSRQDQKQHVEAENIAKNLMQAMEASSNQSLPEQKRMAAVATVSEILNDKHSTKVLNKVYKGWLEKSKEAQKSGKAPSPEEQGFEKGIQDYFAGKTQQGPQLPSTVGGYRIPQQGPAQQAATTQAQTGAITAQQDLARAKAGQPTAAQAMEQAKYGAEMEKYTAERAKAKEETKKAALDVQRAQFEVQKVQSESKLKQAEAQIAEEKGKVSLELEQKRLLTAQTGLEVARVKLEAARSGGKITPQISMKWGAINKASDMLDTLLKNPPSWWFDEPPQSITALQGQLKAAGLNFGASLIPSKDKTHIFLDVKQMLESVKDDLISHKNTLQEAYPKLTSGTSKPKTEESDEGEEDDPLGVLPKSTKP
jgi:hypothetical protein